MVISGFPENLNCPWTSPLGFDYIYTVGYMEPHVKLVEITLLENLTDDAIAKFYVTKFSTISLYLTKLYVS